MKKILNLYAGIGGNRKLWDGDIQVTAVEIDPDIAKIYSDFFPKDIVVVGDAHQYLLDHYSEFDFIWSSPPCQTHSVLCSAKKGWGIVGYPDMKLYQEIILLKHFFDGKFVVENVHPYYKPLVGQYTEIGRHLFWSNFHIYYCSVNDPMKGFGHSKFSDTISVYENKLGYDLCTYKLKNKRQVLRNCVNSEIGKHIFDCAIGSIKNEEQLKLF